MFRPRRKEPIIPSSSAIQPHFLAQSQDLIRLTEAGRLRTLTSRHGIDFCSNDYLGLASSRKLSEAISAAIDRGVPAGSGGSRLLRGNHEEHERLEAEAASFFGSESALYFASGYAANSVLLSTLPQRSDLIIHDALIHASAHEGLKLSRAEHVSARHNDPAHVEELARDWRRHTGTGRIWIVVESLYSMDGDEAPLAELIAVADRFEAILVVDEAHTTGVYGEGGQGLVDRSERKDNLITLHTCGKALGCEGALLCAPKIVRDFLVNRGRGFIFTTAPSPLMAAAVRAALQIVAEGSGLRDKLWAKVDRAQRWMARLGCQRTESQIIPIILGNDIRTMSVARDLQQMGFDVRGIRPPTVPKGTSRLRISVTLNAADDEIDGLCRALATVL